MRCLMSVFVAAVAMMGCSRVDTSKSVSTPADETRPQDRDVVVETPAPDNTAVNRRDVNSNAKTPINQNENQRDVSLVADIRKQILDTENLSVNARNSKVIVQDGKVTLRGPVNSDAERDTIAQIATKLAGEGNVDNQLEVTETTQQAAVPTTDRK